MKYPDSIPGRITFKDLDGNLIMDRTSDASFWMDGVLRNILESDARERGVRIVSVDEKTKTLVSCTVDYLKKKAR